MLRIPFRAPLSALALALAALAGATTARAQGTPPGSLLVFPEFDNRPGVETLISITNTSPSGSVDVHLHYVDEATCLEFDRFERLTPRDTITILTAFHGPPGKRGSVWAVAVDPLASRAFDFDHLIGAATVIDGPRAQDRTLQAFAYPALTGAGNATDLDHDGRPDLDGLEYERAPARVFVPRFFGQPNNARPRAPFLTDLLLVRPLARPGTTVDVAFLLYNDNEQAFSAERSFSCWERVRLSDVSGAFRQDFLAFTDQDPAEVVGIPALEAGWFLANATRETGSAGQQTLEPPLIGVLIETRPNGSALAAFVDR